MTNYSLKKGNTTISIRIGKDKAHERKTVNGEADSTTKEMNPVTALRRVNELMRAGYKA